MVGAPASSRRLTTTGSFHGARTTGSIGVLPIACSMCATSAMSIGECSASTMAHSKPLQPIASATSGLADIRNVPRGTGPPPG
jgi:hypothetical protein